MYTRVYLQDEEGSTMESCLHDMLNDMSREARQILQGMRSMDEPADCVTAGEILAALALQHLTGSVEREAEDGRQDDLSDQSDFHEDVCERVAANLTETLVYWLNDHHNIRRIKDIVSRMASRSEEITKPSYIGQFEQTIIEDMEQLASEFGLSVDPGQLPTHSTAAQDLILRYIREGREGSTLQAIAVQELKNLGILQEQEPAEEQAQIWKDYDVPNQDEQEPQVEGLVSHPVTPGMLYIAINKLTGYWPGVEADKKRINEMDEDDRKQAWQYVLNFNLRGLMDYNILRIPDTYSTEYLLGPDGLETMHLLANPRSRKSQDELIWMLKAKIDDRYDNFIHLATAVRNLSRDGYFRAWCAVHFDDPDTLRQLGVVTEPDEASEQKSGGEPQRSDVDSPTVAQTMKSLNMWLSRMRSELTANPDPIRESSVQERNRLLAIDDLQGPVRLYKQGILIDQDQQDQAARLTSPRSNENLSRSIYYLLMKYRPESELNEGVLIQQTDEQRRKIEQWLALGKQGLDYMEQHGIIRAPDETDKEPDSGNPPSET